MSVGIISGTGMYALAGLDRPNERVISTPFGETSVGTGSYAGVEVLHISRHGRAHARLSSSVKHRAHIWALAELGASSVIGLTACGSLDPSLEPGALVVFDDLHFISNRLADGSLCTFFTAPGDPARGHWVLDGGPFSPELRGVLTGAARAAGLRLRSSGVYGHVDGPRFNTPAEIAALAHAGVVAVSQTGGPETVLCGELELPFALVGYISDFANGVSGASSTPATEAVEPGAALAPNASLEPGAWPDPGAGLEPDAGLEPTAALVTQLARAPAAFNALLAQALPRLAALERPPAPAGTVLRLGSK